MVQIRKGADVESYLQYRETLNSIAGSGELLLMRTQLRLSGKVANLRWPEAPDAKDLARIQQSPLVIHRGWPLIRVRTGYWRTTPLPEPKALITKAQSSADGVT